MEKRIGEGLVAGDVLIVLPGSSFVVDLRDPHEKRTGDRGQHGNAAAGVYHPVF